MAPLAPILAVALVLAADVPATPADYAELIDTLQPGDTLVLAPGQYTRMTISGVHGTADAWITISGPAQGEPAVVVGESCCNTVQLYDSSFVAIENLTVDASGLFVDAINAKDSTSHNIRIENNLLTGFPNEQQIVGINTKATVWNWTIRGNTIMEAGTGLYLGGSEGDTPFINGVIENNLVVNPVGYCMQIKHQYGYEETGEMPPSPHSTIIRHNVFIKDDRESTSGDRPNLLVGGFPDAGPGSDDLYEIYGNLLFYNPRESLFQGTGRMSIHDNIFLAAGDGQTAMALTSHQGLDVRLAHVYNNTVYGGATGISVSGTPDQGDLILGNVVLANTPISGGANVAENITGSVADAASLFASTSMELGMADVYPQVGALQGASLDLSAFAEQVDYDRDYNGEPKGGFEFRGAYAGEGDNPGCALEAEIKDCAGGSDPGDDDGTATDSGDGDTTGESADGDSGVSDDVATSGDASGGSGSADGAEGPSEDGSESGCGCRHHGDPSGVVFVLGAWVLLRRRSVVSQGYASQ